MYILALLITMFVYGAFPVSFAIMRKKPITKKKYTRLCYGINFIGLVFFVALNGASNGAPYLLWTWIFSNYGAKTLETKGLLASVVPAEVENVVVSDNKICYCRKCGTHLEDGSRFCRKCGTEIKEEQ